MRYSLLSFIKKTQWLFLFLFIAFLYPLNSKADGENRQQIPVEAKGKKVFFYAWGGSEKVNDYLSWVSKRVKEKYAISLKHVKLTDTGLAVSQILAEKSGGNHDKGLIDLVWINGENFRLMKSNDLLYGPFPRKLPNSKFIALDTNQAFTYDFNIPTEGYELPWGLSKLVFVYDADLEKTPPTGLKELLSVAQKNKGRVTYPKPPDFTGTSFLKQLLYEFIKDKESLKTEPSRKAFEKQTAEMWNFLEKITPSLWNEGKAYPKNESALRQLFNDGEINYYFTFAPLSVSVDVQNGNLPEESSIFIPKNGSIGNAHFVAIPYNSPRKGAAMVVADFLISPEAQLKKQSLDFWGDFTVLDYDRLGPKEKREFDDLKQRTGSPTPADLGKFLPEPHPAWGKMIENEWKKRFENL